MSMVMGSVPAKPTTTSCKWWWRQYWDSWILALIDSVLRARSCSSHCSSVSALNLMKARCGARQAPSRRRSDQRAVTVTSGPLLTTSTWLRASPVNSGWPLVITTTGELSMEVLSWEIRERSKLWKYFQTFTFISARTLTSYWRQGTTRRLILSLITSRPETGWDTPAGKEFYQVYCFVLNINIILIKSYNLAVKIKLLN